MSEWSELMDSPEWVARCRHCGYRRRDHFVDNVCPDKSSPCDHSAWPETRYEAQDDAALAAPPDTKVECRVSNLMDDDGPRCVTHDTPLDWVECTGWRCDVSGKIVTKEAPPAALAAPPVRERTEADAENARLEARIAELEPMATGEYFKPGVSRMQLEVERAKVENARLREEINVWIAMRTDLTGEIARLREALGSLRNEVAGAICVAESGIKAAIGYTNLQCIERRLDEADAALAAQPEVNE